MRNMYPPRRKHGDTRSERVQVSLHPETIESFKRIQNAFTGRYPALSGLFEQVLARHAERLNNDPEALAEEVSEFEKRYRKAK